VVLSGDLDKFEVPNRIGRCRPVVEVIAVGSPRANQQVIETVVVHVTGARY
jgi:hypothetical protein